MKIITESEGRAQLSLKPIECRLLLAGFELMASARSPAAGEGLLGSGLKAEISIFSRFLLDTLSMVQNRVGSIDSYGQIFERLKLWKLKKI